MYLPILTYIGIINLLENIRYSPSNKICVSSFRSSRTVYRQFFRRYTYRYVDVGKCPSVPLIITKVY